VTLYVILVPFQSKLENAMETSANATFNHYFAVGILLPNIAGFQLSYFPPKQSWCYIKQ
jgi:hypothetical protein